MILSLYDIYFPFFITPNILTLSQNISYILEGEKLDILLVKLRRENNIKTIHSSLAIEGNTLSIEHVTHILEGKHVIGPQKDILEVINALAIYEKFDQLNPLSMRDFMYAHQVLMKDLVKENGGKGTLVFLKVLMLLILPPHQSAFLG